MTAQSVPDFRRIRKGYDPVAVDAYIGLMVKTQECLLDKIRTLQTELADSSANTAQLEKENEALKDTSTSTPAMTHRISKLLQTAVEEVSDMHTEARAEVAARTAEAEAAADKLLNEARLEAQRCLAEAQRDTDVVADERISMLEQLAALHRKLDGVPAFLELAYRQRGNESTSHTRELTPLSPASHV